MKRRKQDEGQREGSCMAEDDAVDIEHADSNRFEEYEWCGQKRIRATTLLEGGFRGSGFVMCSGKENPDSDADLDVDGDDTLEYGKPQYTEADVIPCTGEEPGEAKEREALRGAVLNGGPPSTRITPEFSKWASDEMPSTSNGEGSKQEAMQKTCKNSDIEKITEESAVTTFEALKARVRELERQLSRGDRYKCLICMDSYSMPLTSRVPRRAPAPAAPAVARPAAARRPQPPLRICICICRPRSLPHPIMSVAGLKKQFHKATQKVSEKVGGAEGTKLDDDFKEMERKVDVTSRAVMEIMTKTIEYLQPNPASRAKLSMINTMSKIRGQEKGPGYPQAEALLAEAMLKFGRELGDDCNFGPALGEVGEAMRELSEVKDSLDMEVKQNFIDPLQNLHDKDLREIQHHLKKLEGRRLDFDYKKKRQGKIPDEELRQALEKFDESKEIAESSMFNLLEMDIEQVSQLSALVQAQLEYHKQAVQILQQVTVRLEERIRQASSQPRREYQPKPRMSLEFATGDSTQPNGGLSHTGTPKPPGVQMDQPCCRALYDFEPENEGELGFKEGDIITLTNQIDENWYEGMLHGQSGFFPINYVEILVALPH